MLWRIEKVITMTSQPISFWGIRFQGNFLNAGSIERDQLHQMG